MVQDLSRQQLALIYQLYQVFDCRYTKQRLLSAEICGFLFENNQLSMDLLKRIFPKGMQLFLKEIEKKSIIGAVIELRNKGIYIYILHIHY
jgi:hypothetical protein